MPKAVEVAVIPLINLALAFFISGLVVLWIGENPLEALYIIIKGSIGSAYGWGYTLYYATNFIFTGLAVAVAFHARMFNIGGEGQATLGGLGAALVCLSVDWPHWLLAFPAAIVGAGVFGAAWAAIPAWLQAKKGSHIVITTIMFNFIASALLVYLLVNVSEGPGPDDTRDIHLSARRPPANGPRDAGLGRDRFPEISTRQCVVSSRHCGMRLRLGADLAYTARLRHPCIRFQ